MIILLSLLIVLRFPIFFKWKSIRKSMYLIDSFRQKNVNYLLNPRKDFNLLILSYIMLFTIIVSVIGIINYGDYKNLYFLIILISSIASLVYKRLDKNGKIKKKAKMFFVFLLINTIIIGTELIIEINKIL